MAAGGQVTMREVAAALGVSAGSATRVVDNLVRDGLEECYGRLWMMTFRSIPEKRVHQTMAALELPVDAVEDLTWVFDPNQDSLA